MTVPAALAGGLFSSCSIRAKITVLSTGPGRAEELRARRENARTREEAMTDLTRRTVLSARRRAPARSAPARPRRRQGRDAAGRQAGAGVLPLQGRRHRGHGGDRRRQRFPLPDNFIVNAKKEEVEAALAAAYMPPGRMTTLHADRREHRREARPHRYRLRRGEFRAQATAPPANSMTNSRPPASTPTRRYGHHLALSTATTSTAC